MRTRYWLLVGVLSVVLVISGLYLYREAVEPDTRCYGQAEPCVTSP
jgi:hypothetical protein